MERELAVPAERQPAFPAPPPSRGPVADEEHLPSGGIDPHPEARKVGIVEDLVPGSTLLVFETVQFAFGERHRERRAKGEDICTHIARTVCAKPCDIV